MSGHGIHSPPTPRSDAPSPRPKFDSDLLKGYIKKLLSSTLQGANWPQPKERDRTKAWCKEIGERVKERMLEIEPRGFKYIVLTRIDEHLGQGSLARIMCHWEDSDTVAQEMFTNDTIICVCVAFAIRTV